MATNRHAVDDYGTPVTRTNKMRPLILANHVLHLISSIIVLGISAYFISEYSHNVHLRYWVSVAAVDTFLYIPALALPFMKSYKGYLAPLAWVFSYLWLTAFIFAAQDYNFGNCVLNSPRMVNKCSLKKTLQAFAFLAFFTNLVGTLIESRLWDFNRATGAHHTHGDKHHTAVGDAPGAHNTNTAAV